MKGNSRGKGSSAWSGRGGKNDKARQRVTKAKDRQKPRRGRKQGAAAERKHEVNINRPTGAAAAIAALLGSIASASEAAQCRPQSSFAVVVHGGEISQRVVDNGRLAAMLSALVQGRADLAAKKSSLDVVETIVR